MSRSRPWPGSWTAVESAAAAGVGSEGATAGAVPGASSAARTATGAATSRTRAARDTPARPQSRLWAMRFGIKSIFLRIPEGWHAVNAAGQRHPMWEANTAPDHISPVKFAPRGADFLDEAGGLLKGRRLWDVVGRSTRVHAARIARSFSGWR